MIGTASIPTIDISPFQQDPASDAAREVVEQVRAACTSLGFLQIVGHGVSRELQQEVLDGAATFFRLPLEEKKKVDRAVPGAGGRGYEVMGSQEQKRGLGGDLKEGFYASTDVPVSDPLAKTHPGLVGPNRFPDPQVLPHSVFKQPVDRYIAEMHRVVRILFRIVAAGMPYGPDVFDGFIGGHALVFLSPKHYPPSGEERLGCGPHTDFGALTLLLQDGHGGLQVQHGEAWLDVTPNPDAYVVNIGNLMQRLTRGAYKSTVHRVVAPSGGKHRYSLPFFFNGNIDYPLVPLDGARPGDDKVMTVTEHMIERFMATYLEKKKKQEEMQNQQATVAV